MCRPLRRDLWQMGDGNNLHGGGEMIATVTYGKTTYAELPFKFEAGTPDYVGSVALAEAIRYMQKLGVKAIGDYENQLLQYATGQLMNIDGMRIFGTAAEKASVISFLVRDIHHFDMELSNWLSTTK